MANGTTGVGIKPTNTPVTSTVKKPEQKAVQNQGDQAYKPDIKPKAKEANPDSIGIKDIVGALPLVFGLFNKGGDGGDGGGIGKFLGPIMSFATTGRTGNAKFDAVLGNEKLMTKLPFINNLRQQIMAFLGGGDSDKTAQA